MPPSFAFGLRFTVFRKPFCQKVRWKGSGKPECTLQLLRIKYCLLHSRLKDHERVTVFACYYGLCPILAPCTNKDNDGDTPCFFSNMFSSPLTFQRWLWHGAKSFHSLFKCQCSTTSWPLVSFSYFNARMKVTCFGEFGIPGTCLSRHRITAMNVCDSRFDRLWHGAKSSHSLFSCQLPEWGPPIGHACRTCTSRRCKGSVQHGLFEDSRSVAAVKTLQHCCIKLDIQKEGSSEGSPAIVKNNALMSSSSKSRSIEKPLF